MNTELSPQIRSLVSGLAAIAITGFITTTLVESMKPLLFVGSGESFAPISASDNRIVRINPFSTEKKWTATT